MRLCTGLLLTILLCFIQTVASASSQKLLDELAKSPTVEEAQPIIDALWRGWINGHKSLDEKDLMENGILAMTQGRLNDAEATFSELIQKRPEFLEAWNKRATVRFMLSKLEESKEDIFEVLNLEPRHFGALSGLGMIYLKLGNLNDAMETYKNLQSIFPANPETESYIALLRHKLGLTDL